VQAEAQCSDRGPVAYAIALAILVAIGVALGAFAHWVLAGVTPGWIPAAVPLLLALIPVGMYYPVVSRLRLSFADLARCSSQSRR
jgi:hypothetical protein